VINNTELINRLKKNTALAAVSALVIFGFVGVVAALIGRFIDAQLGTTPVFSLVILLISYIVGWIAVLRVRKEILANIPDKKEEK
jgi:F0F1-type ATP synthase assembly protein I